MVGVPDPVLRLCSKPTTGCGEGQVRPDPDISINVDIRNPGQFFACCGLLEISSRIWPDSEGWFEITGRRTTYCIATSSEHDDPLESVRKHQAGLQSFRSMRRIEASRRNASALRLRFSQSLASLRQRLSQAKVRSTTQRRGSTTNPFVRSERLTISVSS